MRRELWLRYFCASRVVVQQTSINIHVQEIVAPPHGDTKSYGGLCCGPGVIQIRKD